MLSIIIPAYNEEICIAKSVESLCHSFRPLFQELEIIVVDDGSLDKTAQIVRMMKTHYENKVNIKLIQNITNKGKGFSIKRGALEASGDKIVFIDADLSYDIESIKYLTNSISEEKPIVIGSRVLPESQVSAKISWFRFLSGRIYSILIQLFMFQNIPDTQCGLKGFTSKFAKEVFPFLTINGFAFDVELLFISRKKKYNIFQIPIRMISHRTDSRLNMAVDPIIMFLALFRIRLNDLLGIYG